MLKKTRKKSEMVLATRQIIYPSLQLPYSYRLQLCYSSVTALLQLSLTTLLQLCHSSVTTLLQLCYSSVTALLQLCYNSVTALLQLCYNCVTVLLRLCNSSVHVNCPTFYGSTHPPDILFLFASNVWMRVGQNQTSHWDRFSSPIVELVVVVIPDSRSSMLN